MEVLKALAFQALICVSKTDKTLEPIRLLIFLFLALLPTPGFRSIRLLFVGHGVSLDNNETRYEINLPLFTKC